MEECASDLAELPACGGACQSVPVIWQKSLLGEEHASDLAELPLPVIWQNCLYVEECAIVLAE